MFDVVKIAARPFLTAETGDKQGTFSERKAAQYFRIMVEVIHHCHQLGVIHRCNPETTSMGSAGNLEVIVIHQKLTCLC
jgi:hypothetical protein